MTDLQNIALRFIGKERGLCRCCGRAHFVGHESDCPVPDLLKLAGLNTEAVLGEGATEGEALATALIRSWGGES